MENKIVFVSKATRAILPILALVLSVFCTGQFARSQSSSTSLDTEMKFWKANGFECNLSGAQFPSKEIKGHADQCDDGDMTLFNGLLCSAGLEEACLAVKNSQDAQGRWWRSPRRIGIEAPTSDVSFSPDQSLGVLLYAEHKNDGPAFSKWLSWIEGNRPCLATLGDRCLQKGWLRFCTDDADKRCTLRPADCERIEAVAKKLGVDGNLCRRVLDELHMSAERWPPLEDWTLSSSIINDIGYPLHLAAVSLYLEKLLGANGAKLDIAAKTLKLRDADNPFFGYLADGATSDVMSKVLVSCPAEDRLSTNRFQWTWERKSKPDEYSDSMYWDCIFMGKLLGSNI